MAATRLATRAPTCPACGRRDPADARWCGDCGALLGRGDDAASLHLDVDELRAEPVAPHRHRGAWAAVLVVALVVTGVVADPGTRADTDLLGRADDLTGRSSTLPPVDGLQLRWRRVVDAADAAGGGPVELVELADGTAVVDRRVVARTADGAAASGEVLLPADMGRPDATGRLLLVVDDEVVTADAATGRVLRRAPVGPTADGWRPVGAALGWVAGAAVLADADGVIGAVTARGEVRWTGEPGWRWDGAGDGTDWLVVVAAPAGVGPERVLVVDGRTGAVHRDVGPVGTVHAPVVHGDVLVFVDPFSGIDRGLGHPVEVRGMRLDGSGRLWAATDLPPTAGTPTAVGVTPVEDGVAVHYWTTGHATVAIWFDAPTGTRLGSATVGGSGRTAEGWPVATVVGDAIAHVDPVRDSIRVVDRRGLVRWSVPALPGEGVVADGGTLLARTPPRGTSLQSRLRLLDADTGATRWSRTVDSTEEQRLSAVHDGHVGLSSGGGPVPPRDQSWFALDSGRRRSGHTLLATVPVTPPVEVVPGLLADDQVRVTVTAGGLVARDEDGAVRWSRRSAVLLRRDLAVLLEDAVVAVGVDGRVRSWARADGRPRWTGPPDGVTAVTAGGDVVVVGTRDGEVLVLGAAGAVRQRLRAGWSPVEDVAVVAGHVIATVGQDVVAFGRGAAVVEPPDRVRVP